VQRYTISEASQKLGIEKRKIMRLIKTREIEATKGENARSPYQITENELLKLCDIVGYKTVQEKKEAVSSIPIEPKTDSAQNARHYNDFIQIQKILVETMRDLAATQEKIAETLRELVKKV